MQAQKCQANEKEARMKLHFRRNYKEKVNEFPLADLRFLNWKRSFSAVAISLHKDNAEFLKEKDILIREKNRLSSHNPDPGRESEISGEINALQLQISTKFSQLNALKKVASTYKACDFVSLL
jgi:hypothetical protein